jgi:hypothetical protein
MNAFLLARTRILITAMMKKLAGACRVSGVVQARFGRIFKGQAPPANDLRGTRCGMALIDAGSNTCSQVGRSDMAENYMFSAPPEWGTSTGFNFLPLQTRCVLWTHIPFVALAQERDRGFWFEEENDNRAVPMQPYCLDISRTNNFGSSWRSVQHKHDHC